MEQPRFTFVQYNKHDGNICKMTLEKPKHIFINNVKWRRQQEETAKFRRKLFPPSFMVLFFSSTHMIRDTNHSRPICWWKRHKTLSKCCLTLILLLGKVFLMIRAMQIYPPFKCLLLWRSTFTFSNLKVFLDTIFFFLEFNDKC